MAFKPKYSYGKSAGKKIKLNREAAAQAQAMGVTKQQLAENNARHNAAAKAGTLKPRWTAQRINTTSGNARVGSSYRVGFDDDGSELHLYGSKAGGDRQVVAVGKKKAKPRTTGGWGGRGL